MEFYAHSFKEASKDEWQSLREHLIETAEQAAKFSKSFNAEKLGYAIGLLHDLGKYSIDFQKRLEGSNKKVDHSSAGAQEAVKYYGKNIGKVMAFVIAGHHGGLPDGNKGNPSNLPERLSKRDIPNYMMFEDEIEIPTITNEDLSTMPSAFQGMEAFSFAFCIRMLYSCLVDADYLDTERFMNIEKYLQRPDEIDLEIILHKFEKKLQELGEKNNANPSVINSARQVILNRCLEMSSSKPGFYSLTVPTGGGKTYSSLAFALKHAVKHSKKRIIYVIPYTSIIEQNAQIFKEALGYNVVLEHHSTFEYPEGNFDDWDNNKQTLKLASENWDMPVVVTTNVQFFESLFGNKSSRCRKLHNIANSVIILDEAQMMPMEYLKPCLWTLTELIKNYGTTVIFCTATQPAIKEYIPGGLKPVEIMENPAKLQQIFKRVNVNYRNNMSDQIIAQEMASVSQVLVIVNTRRHARLLFDQLQNNIQTQMGIYHLSARMCPAHRKELLEEIRQRLWDGQDCKVVSTQLIEAGVDIDFPLVYRAAAGLDSIVQAAGRCNREGKLDVGNVMVFEPEPHGMPKKGGFDAAAAMTRSTIRRLEYFHNDLLSLEAIDDYFRQYMNLNEDILDSRQVLKMINQGANEMAFPFERIAGEFQIIDSPMFPVVVPWDERAEKLMTEAEYSRYPVSKARSLQPYTVQVYQHELAGLEKEGVIKIIGGFMRFLTDKSFYSYQVGLKDAKEVKVPEEVLLF